MIKFKIHAIVLNRVLTYNLYFFYIQEIKNTLREFQAQNDQKFKNTQAEFKKDVSYKIKNVYPDRPPESTRAVLILASPSPLNDTLKFALPFF